jgi:peptidyl-prolyl cis-trans isomerase NIMA-interacting 1
MWASLMLLAASGGCGGCEGCGLGCDGPAAEETAAAPTPSGHPVTDASGPEPDPSPPSKYAADAEACARVIVVAFEGVQGPMTVSRTREEAKVRAEELRSRVVGGGESLAQVAQSDSDLFAYGAGALGIQRYGDWIELLAEARDPVFDLEIGEISPIIETKAGYVVAVRCPDEVVRVRHILIRYRGALAAPGDLRRTKGRAERDARMLLERVRAGEDMAELAREHTDDEETRAAGGDLGKVTMGFLPPEMEDAAFTLRSGEVSDVVETRFGFHILKRERDTGAE